MSQKKYIQLEFSVASPEQNELLIALLSDKGFSGFEEVDGILKGFIETTVFNAAELDTVIEMVPVKYMKSEVTEENWNAQWEGSFEPIVLNDFAAIRAAFHEPVPHVKHDIIITPKMSFGTGHHATTYMMMEQMQSIDFAGKQVVDYGTGTAVLAILAEKMGATSVDAIDYDDWCIENGNENIVSNKCEHINMIKSDSISTGKNYDVILANINLNVILNGFSYIQKAATAGTNLLLSGFLQQDEPEMLDALKKHGFKHVKTMEKSGWICVLARFN